MESTYVWRGDILRKHRKKTGIRPEAIAYPLEITVATLYNWETGYSQPSAVAAFRLADLFGIDVMEFYDVEEAKL